MKSKNLVLCLQLVFFLTTAIPTSEEGKNELVIWDVGQGAWATFITSKTCIHIDVGGERIPKNVRKRCLGKQNQIHLTHWDRDHIQFFPWIQKNLSNLCAGSLPPGEPSKSLRHIALNAWALKKCETQTNNSSVPKLHEIQDPVALEFAKTSNARSQIFEFENLALLPGDSGQKEETQWSSRIKTCPKILVLGHHGSRTSTSKTLLNKMKCLTLAIASSRRKRYGHPDAEVVGKVRAFGAPVMTTEAWGDILIPYAGRDTRIQKPYGLKGLYSISRSRAKGSYTTCPL